MPTHKIVRFCRDRDDPRNGEVSATGLTLDEAQAHCQSEDTSGDDYFDGYECEEE